MMLLTVELKSTDQVNHILSSVVLLSFLVQEYRTAKLIKKTKPLNKFKNNVKHDFAVSHCTKLDTKAFGI